MVEYLGTDSTQPGYCTCGVTNSCPVNTRCQCDNGMLFFYSFTLKCIRWTVFSIEVSKRAILPFSFMHTSWEEFSSKSRPHFEELIHLLEQRGHHKGGPPLQKKCWEKHRGILIHVKTRMTNYTYLNVVDKIFLIGGFLLW